MTYLPGMAPRQSETQDGYCDHRETPRHLFDLLNRDFGPFDLDGAASDKNHLCERYFTAHNDALSQPWGPTSGRASRCFCNPPYPSAVLGAFACKALAEAMAGRASTLMLCPCTKTEQTWWHKYVCDPLEGASGLWFVEGRIAFWLGGREPEKSAPDHNSVLILWEVGRVTKAQRWWYRLPTVGSYSQARGRR